MADKPKLQDYMLPLLTLFADGEEHAYEDIPAHLEQKYSLLQADTAARSGIMVNGALGYFKKAHVLEQTDHRRFKITDRGRELLSHGPQRLTVQDLRQFPEFDDFITARYKRSGEGPLTTDLMIDYDIGVGAVRTYALKQLDSDYFVMARRPRVGI